MKKRFLEGFRRFVAIFVLVQMILVLFPAPAVYAGSEGTQSTPDTSFADPQFAEYPYSNNEPLQIEAENYSGAKIDFTFPELTSPDPSIVVGCYTPDSSHPHDEILPGDWLPISEHIVTCKAVDGGVIRGKGIQFTIEIYDGRPVIAVNEPEEYFVEIGTEFINPWTATVTDTVDDYSQTDLLETVIGVVAEDSDGNPVGSCDDITVECELEKMIDTTKEGKLIITYTATDSAGNDAEPVTRTVNVVDEDRLEFTFIEPPTPQDNHIQKADNFKVRIGEEAVDSEIYYIESCSLSLYSGGKKIYGPFDMTPVGNQDVTSEREHNLNDLEDGTYEYIVSCWNKEKGTTSLSRKITIDRKAPVLNFVTPTPANGSVINEGSFEVRVAGNEKLGFCNIFLNGQGGPMTEDKKTGQWFISFTGLPENVYNFLVSCSDLADNSDITETRFLTVDFVAEPVVLTPVTLFTPVAYAAPVEEVQDVIAATTDKDAEEVLGEEVPGARDVCNWWWIISLILAVLLFGNYLLARRFEAQDIDKKILMVTPIALGLLALYAHQLLGKDLDHPNWCDYLWLIIAVLVLAYYVVKNYLPKTEKPKKTKK